MDIEPCLMYAGNEPKFHNFGLKHEQMFLQFKNKKYTEI